MGDLWDRLLSKFEKHGSCQVQRHALWLGTRDGETGWRKKFYYESAVDMIIIPRGATSSAVTAGTYVRLDAVGLTDTAVEEGDEIETSGGTYYEVKTVREHCLTPDTIEYYECDLTKLPLHV